MKKLFFTGLIILLPFTLTLFIVIFLINFFTNPFQGVVESALSYYHLPDTSFLFLSKEQVMHMTAKLLALIALFVMTIFIGFLGQVVLLNVFFRFGDFMMRHIPLVRKIYKVTQDVVKTIFQSKDTCFSQVVLAPFPHNKAYSIGLVSSASKQTGKDTVSIFIPGTPNPTMGFILNYRPDDLIYIEMKTEEALKFVISCGLLFSELGPRTKKSNKNDKSNAN